MERGFGVKKDKEWLKQEVWKQDIIMDKGYIYTDDLMSIINEVDDPEKIIIPQFVADWWERDDDSVTMYGRLRVEKKHKFDLVSIFYDKGLGDYLSKVEDWIYENDSVFLDLVNGKPYEVEKEQRYYVRDENDTLLCKSNGVVMTVGKLWAIGNEHEAEYDLTEQEIKDYDERFWPFAVEVEG